MNGGTASDMTFSSPGAAFGVHQTFAITAVGTIGIAIAANTTIFSFVDALLFERLPYANPDALVVIRKGVVGLLGEALTIRERARVLADLAVYRPTAVTLDDAQDSHETPHRSTGR